MKQLVLALITCLAVLAAGCSNNKIPIEIYVSAASSLNEVLLEVKEIFEEENPHLLLRLNFASSGTLQQQIEQGAPVDIFVSAGEQQMKRLLAKDLVEAPLIIAHNTLVIILPQHETIKVQNIDTLRNPNFKKIAIGNPEIVPAGKYANEALENAGIWEGLQKRLVLTKDVRQVLAYVESGNVDAGIVYATDALASKKLGKVLPVPKAYHAEITYPAAVIKASKQQADAEKFLDYLLSDKAQDVFNKYGFIR